MENKRLAAHLEERPSRLADDRKHGVKIVGYFPGNFVPEELIYAAGAVPLCLVRGGSRPADAALSVVPQVICPFARAQLGERLLGENPYYNMLDMLVAPITCQHLKKVAEIWEYRGGLEIFKLGVPQQCISDYETAYFTDRLKALKERLEALTGNEITDAGLGEAIELYNHMRGLLRSIGTLRQAPSPPVSALDFVKLNHASFYADPAFMVDYLESVYSELKEKQAATANAPRILLVGPNIGDGDYTVLEMVEKAGGEIVAEEICEGIRDYRQDVGNGGDPLQALTRGYLLDRMPCAFLRNSAARRLEHALRLVEEYKVSGVIWYELLCCETYDSESYYFAEKLGERDIPVLVLESDYSTAATGQLKTRIQGFIEILEGVME